MNKILVLFFALVFSSAFATTWYVAKNGKDTNTGKSEGMAFLTIQKAIDSAKKGDEILVSKGTYDYVTIDAAKEPLWIRATGNNSECIIKGQSGHRCVTVGTGTTTNVFVIGFTLTGGNLSGAGNNGAGAMGGTYSNCVITANVSGSITTAAGAFNCVLQNCVVSNNICNDWTGGIQDCLAIDCIITGNKSTYVGSGGAASSILIRCNIIGNSTASSGKGGGCGDCKIYQCIVQGNTGGWASEVNGGELYDCLILATGGNRIMCAASCYNCTIVSSESSHNIWRDTRLYNCLLSGSGGGLSVNGDSNWSVDLRNCFLDTVTLGPYTTQSNCLKGRANFVGNDNYRLQKSSPCIDAGDNSYSTTDTDLAGKVRIYNGKVDIGAYEYQPDVFGGIRNIVAKQRYPWNGLVDFSSEVTGDPATAYKTSFLAHDHVSATNIPSRTIYASDGSRLSVTNSLKPGVYRWIWNALADLPNGFVSERMTIEGNVEEP